MEHFYRGHVITVGYLGDVVTVNTSGDRINEAKSVYIGEISTGNLTLIKEDSNILINNLLNSAIEKLTILGTNT